MGPGDCGKPDPEGMTAGCVRRVGHSRPPGEVDHHEGYVQSGPAKGTLVSWVDDEEQLYDEPVTLPGSLLDPEVEARLRAGCQAFVEALSGWAQSTLGGTRSLARQRALYEAWKDRAPAGPWKARDWAAVEASPPLMRLMEDRAPSELVIARYLQFAPEQGEWPDDEHAAGLASGIVEALRRNGYTIVEEYRPI